MAILFYSSILWLILLLLSYLYKIYIFLLKLNYTTYNIVLGINLYNDFNKSLKNQAIKLSYIP